MTKRCIVVSGASSGIGKAVATRLLHEGHTVIGISRRVAEASFDHPRFHAFPCDLADLKELPVHLTSLLQRHRDIDGLVACAGVGQFGSLEEFSYTQIRQLIDINLTSQIMLVRAMLPTFKRQGRGDIVMIGSEAALSGGRRGAVYCATKFAVRGFVQALREECAKNRIRVSLINPGMVDTPFFDTLHFAPGEAEENYIVADDVAQTVAFVLNARVGTVFDEINLSPQKTVLRVKR